jgi:hypothetical protein
VPKSEGANLYKIIDAYLDRHRKVLLAHAVDPGIFFVVSVKSISKFASYNMSDFGRAWTEIIRRYGIYNPYTDRGAIKGLLPHGPHSIRDVLATHILKQTGSYELASYAIQDTPGTIAKHYSRFLPQDKSAQAARVLDRVWKNLGPRIPLSDLRLLPVSDPNRTRRPAFANATKRTKKF